MRVRVPRSALLERNVQKVLTRLRGLCHDMTLDLTPQIEALIAGALDKDAQLFGWVVTKDGKVPCIVRKVGTKVGITETGQVTAVLRPKFVTVAKAAKMIVAGKLHVTVVS